MLGAAKRYVRYGLGVYRFLKRPLSLAECYSIVRDRMENREVNFLTMLERGVYSNPRSPYRRLLEHAGCELGDVRSMVKSAGLESTLRRLSDAGVYITIEEYKGKKPVERNGLSFAAQPEDFDNPDIRIEAGLERASGATRSQGIRTHRGFDFLTDLTAVDGVLYDELGWQKFLYVFWHSSLNISLIVAKLRVPVDKWFFPLTSNENRARAVYAVAVGKAFGCPIPWPKRTGANSAHEVASWLAKNKGRQSLRVLKAKTSLAVRVCLAAQEHNLDISGVHFIAAADPLTPAREQMIRATGCSVGVNYSSSETGFIAHCCVNSTGDDAHFLKSHLAVIEQPRPVGSTEMTVDAYGSPHFYPQRRRSSSTWRMATAQGWKREIVAASSIA